MAKDRMRLFRRFRRDAKGATAVEFAIVITPLLVLLLGIFQMVVLFFYDQALQTAAEGGARLIMTGTAQKAGMNQAAFKTAVCAYVSSLNCNQVYVDVQSSTAFSTLNTTPIVLTYNKSGTPTNTFNYNAGIQTNAAIIRVMYNYPDWWPTLLPMFSNQQGNNFLLTATSVVRNEPYPSS